MKTVSAERKLENPEGKKAQEVRGRGSFLMTNKIPRDRVKRGMSTILQKENETPTSVLTKLKKEERKVGLQSNRGRSGRNLKKGPKK